MMIKQTKGSILVTALWIMTILALLAVGVGFRASLEVRLSRYGMDKLQAAFLAKAGIAKAVERLSNDIKAIDTLHECGISLVPANNESLESIFNAKSDEFPDKPYPVYTYSVYYTYENEYEPGKYLTHCGMMDEERKINIRLSCLDDKLLKELLPDTLSPNDKDAIVNAIKDWQDPDTTELPGGAENTYYENLTGSSKPYKCKNAEFETIEELLLVKGMTKNIFDSIKDYITVYGDDKKININTATRRVLEAVLVVALETEYDEQLIERIINTRRGPDGQEETSDDGLENLSGIGSAGEQGNLNNYFKFNSSYFRITSHGNVRKLTKTITCVVKKGVSPEEKSLLYYHEE